MTNVDLVMISNLEESGGGRETWLKNFLNEIVATDREIKFNLYTLKTGDTCLLDDYNSKVVNKHNQYSYKNKKLPISISFIINMTKNFALKKKNADYMIAVGGLEEALASVFSYGFRGVHEKKILWLRTIYTKEKGYALNRVTQKVLLKIELMVIKLFFDVVIANGEDTAEFYRDLGVECVVIRNSIPLQNWNKLESIKNHDKIKIAYIGRLSKVKGIEDFIKAIDIMSNSKDIKDFEFHVIGEGIYTDTLKKYNNTDEVVIHGAVSNSEVPNILKEMDCCVALTYLNDFLGGGGVSNALIEQMAAGKIIVCWDNNIFRKVLSEESAYLVKQGNVDALINTFINIRADLSAANEKSIKAKDLSNHYSIQNHVNKFFKLIKKD